MKKVSIIATLTGLLLSSAYTIPGNGTAKERTDNFILSPDGKRVLGKEKSADL